MGQSKSKKAQAAALTAASSPSTSSPSPPVITTTSAEDVELTPQVKSMTLPSRLLNSSDRTKTRSIASLSKAFRTNRKKWKTGKKRADSISASFSFHDRQTSDVQVELLNINRATEEELMTLAGVNRALAQNIVAHRLLIGGYRRVEDLALVSGMGASKLGLIRPEICCISSSITRNNNLSQTSSSKSPSLESIPSTNTVMSESSRATNYKPLTPININVCTIFDLMTIGGLDQSIAARIINYRDRKGPYEDLMQLKDALGTGCYKRIGPRLWNQLTTEVSSKALLSMSAGDNLSTASKSPARSKQQYRNSPASAKASSRNASHFRSPSGNYNVAAQDEELVLRTLPAGATSPTLPSTIMTDLFELMSLNSPRPKRDCEFTSTFDSQPAYRIASWNLERLTSDKIGNLGVLEVVTRTILENGLSLVAFQEICDKGSLQKICDELNEPKLPKNREWKQPRGSWSCIVHPSTPHIHFDKTSYYLGLIYNLEVIDEVRVPEISGSFAPIQNGTVWQFGAFTIKIRSSSYVLLNVLSTAPNPRTSSYSNGHAISPEDNNGILTDKVAALIEETNSDGAMLLGYFCPRSIQKVLGDLHGQRDFGRILPESLDNNDEQKEENIRSRNLWLTRVQELYTGEFGVIEEGPTHLAIPNGWGWGGRVTVSSPFWATFYTDRTIKNEVPSPVSTEESSDILALPQS